MPQKVPDNTVSQHVSQVLLQRGFRAPCRIDVSVKAGMVTPTGNIQYENQRRNVIRAAQTVTGVRRVIDKLQCTQKAIWADRAAKPYVPPAEG